VTPKEQEIAIGELEERVDRLRNIYEQYFLGFEKLEPTVPRKDVDRRLAILRKEQIRNTAMRFRFQVVMQKYNTYAMHWIRICRQIEEGTYKRHIRKAKARFGDTARAPERDISVDIDIDMGDFDNLEMDDVLAEANAAAASYERPAPDTVPPPPAPAPARAIPPLRTPGTSFAVAGRRESLADLEPNTPPPSVRTPDRAGRGAALPPGARPLLVRKRDAGEPPSHRTMPGAPPASQQSATAAVSPSQRGVQGAPHSAPRLRPMSPAPRRSSPSSPDLEGEASSPRVTVPTAGASSAGRIAAAGAPAAGRIPVAAPAPGTSASRIQAAPQAAPSAPRVPLASPSSPNPPAPAPIGRPPPAPSAGRVPAPAPSADARPRPPAPSAGRLPAGPPPSDPRMRAPGRAPPPLPKIPPTSLPRPVPVAPRAPMPSSSDREPPDPQARPRAPLPPPLPGPIARPTKKE
jgi:hypothetical protein